MKYYASNVATVLETLAQYGYSDDQLLFPRKFYEDLRIALDNGENTIFMAETARAWCKSSVPISLQEKSLLAVDRLDDVYQYGRILGTHLKIKIVPTEYFCCMVNVYIVTLKCNIRTLNIIRNECLRFCCFVHYHGIERIEELNHSILELYDCFLNDIYKGHDLRTRKGRISAYFYPFCRNKVCAVLAFRSICLTQRLIESLR